MKIRIRKENIDKWWNRAYSTYRITTSAVLLIDGKFCNIETFEGKTTVAKVDGKTYKLKMGRCRKYRCEAIEKRRTFCNHINLSQKYRYNIKDRDCDYCYLASRCSRVAEGMYGKSRLIIKDLMLVSQYFEENRNDEPET
jgi:hypothetical protein